MRIVLFTICAIALMGCPAQTPQGRRANAFKKTIRTIETSVNKAGKAAENIDQYETVVRYNPAQCKCPPFEVYAYGRWMRVVFTGDEDALNGLAEFQTREKQNPSLRTFPVRGKFSGDTERGANNVAYPSFVLELEP